MPEIAEVETVRRTLKKQILNKKIKQIKIIYPNIISSNLEEFQNNLLNEMFIDIKRRGKWLLFETKNYYLCSHLRMEGKFFLKKEEDLIEKHEHIIFVFEDNSDLRYHDTRKFGRMILTSKEKLEDLEPIKKQGIEPIDPKLTKEYLYEKIHNKNLPIKSLLLDQTIISGLGNIYANEVLFDAKISPFIKGKELNLQDLEKIKNSSKKIIEKAIDAGGTTIKSYTSSLGVTGRFQQQLMVHKKENEPCKICKTLIENKKIAGRSTYYCPKCQKV